MSPLLKMDSILITRWVIKIALIIVFAALAIYLFYRIYHLDSSSKLWSFTNLFLILAIVILYIITLFL